jgi:hypothetical protein
MILPLQFARQGAPTPDKVKTNFNTEKARFGVTAP